MKSVILFSLVSVFLISCKSQQGKETVNETESLEVLNEDQGKIIISGKITNKKRAKLAYAAIRLVIDTNQCVGTSSNTKGKFELAVDVSKIKEDSYLEVVYKGYSKKVVPYTNFADGSAIVLDKIGEVISKIDYRIYYDGLQQCKK
ncbi:carboxypeptidase regulatory-like domain-containing protein [Aquimarina sp. RZ0]|uniref:carboxypeptidase regulatory-like domain-containing protein n=1 Tax=Aquimarina sp. RZ0 TaxID=2607730 RepID=UPI0011F16787|nr:carboxypeptidase regulatory-like domain-containing protein [Aquimarina sp. RZ0]KAA1244014.1 carboxypeptidase regulatory-like domain-containing protein [Aquimarina sp. RZ0]